MITKDDYIYGLRAIIEAIDAGRTVDKILLRKDQEGSELLHQLTDRARTYRIPIQRVPIEKLNRITRKNHQGAIALISPVEYHDLDTLIPWLFEQGRTPLILVLDGITDTRNFGAIARTALCAGVDAILIPTHHSVTIGADAVKTSAGALMHIPVCRTQSLPQALRLLQQSGLAIVGATEKTDTLYTATDFTLPTAIVMGAEDTGISPQVLKMCDKLAKIPIQGPIGSLNVSVAAAVLTYEALRQRMAANL